MTTISMILDTRCDNLENYKLRITFTQTYRFESLKVRFVKVFIIQILGITARS